MLVLFSVAMPSAHGASCSSAPSGLIGWWPAGGSAADIASTNNGILQGGATATGAGYANTSFTFDGTNGYVQVPDSNLLRPTNLTIEAWVKFAAFGSAGSGGSPAGDQYIVFRQNTQSSDFEGFDLSKTTVSGTNVFRWLISSPNSQHAELHSATVINTGVWYHVAAVRGSNFTQLYVNGNLERQTNISFPQSYGNFPLYFGTSGQSFWDHKLKGNLDEVSIYNRALSSNEIAGIFSAGASGKCKGPNITVQPTNQFANVGSNVTFVAAATGFGTLAYQWNFNNSPIFGANATSLTLTNVQLSATGNYSVIVSNSLGTTTSSNAFLTVISPPCTPALTNLIGWWRGEGTGVDDAGTNPANLFNGVGFTNGMSGSAFSLDGVDDRIVVSNAPALNFSAGQSFSIEAWVRPQTNLTDLDLMSVVDKRTAPDTGHAQGYEFGLSSGRVVCRLSDSIADVGTLFGPAGPDLRDGAWHHMAVSINRGSPSLGLLLVDGHVVLVFDPSVEPGNLTNGDPLRIGNHATPSLNCFFKGQIDEVSLYNTALTTNQIFAIYTAQSSGKCPLPPIIITGPTNQNVVINSTAIFNIAARGSMPLSYQWRFSSTNIPGATGTSLVLTNVQLSQAGNYAVVVSNSAGAVTSSVANLTVQLPPPCVTPPAGLVAWWPAEGDASESVGALNGSIVNGVTFTTGRKGLAFSFDGLSQYITNASPGVSNALNTYTMEFWAWPTGSRATTAETTSGIQGISNQRYAIFPNNGGYGNVGSGVSVGNNGVSVYEHGGVYLSSLLVYDTPITNWTHVAVVYSNQTPSLYLNGVKVRTGLTSARVSYPSTSLGEIGVNYGYYAGLLDEVSIYNRALSTSEIQAIYNGGALGKCPVAPTILVQPVDQTATLGGPVTLTASIAGSPALMTRWLLNGSFIGSPASNSAGPIAFTIPAIQQTNAGAYQLVVSNAAGSVTSSVAQLKLVYPSTITAWGYDGYGQCDVPAGLNDAVAIAAGGHHSLALRRNGTVVAWGWNGNGQCNVPAGLSNVIAIAGGTYFSSALKADGTVVSWGDLYNGTLAQMPAGLSRATVLDSGGAENLVMKPDATLLAWGYGGDGRLDIPSSATNVLAIAAGHAAHNIALRSDSTIVGWGDGSYGALDIPPGLSNVAQVDLGWGFTTVLKTDGTVAIWGSFTVYGPTYLPPGMPLLDTIACGYEHILGIKPDTTVFSWGYNGLGQTNLPAGLSNVVAVAGGLFHSLTLSRVGPPEMIQHPFDETVVRDGTVEFISSAVGDHLKYQWRLNGTNLAAATLARLLLTNVQPTQTGLYSVVISNSSGLVTSSNATLSMVPLLVTLQPTNQTVYEAADTSFGVTVSGTGPLRYQWLLNGTNIAGATNQTLNLTNVDAAQAGPYSVMVSNVYGFTQSSNAVLTVLLPAITNQPVSQAVIGGQQVTFSVGAVGVALNYQWRLNGSLLSGQTNTSITLTNVSPADAGVYNVVINNNGHRMLLSSNANLTVTPIVISPQPTNAVVLINSNATFISGASATAPLFYQWLKDGTNLTDGDRISGVTSNVLTISGTQTNDAGAYTLLVTNAYTNLLSQAATLTVIFPPSIIQNPASQTNVAGSNAFFSVFADGRQPLTYSWRFTGTVIADGTHNAGTATPSLTVSNLTTADAGAYTVVVGNSDGVVTSAIALLTVALPPTITTPPTSRLIFPGLTNTFSAVASGTAPLGYQWQFNGSDIPGATNTSYIITNVALSNYGAYRVIVSNAWGIATSADAVLGRANMVGWGSSAPIPLSASNIVMISAGNNGNGVSLTHVLALRADGTVVAWGNNGNGQTNVPASATNIVAVAAGGSHSLALRANGTVIGWGSAAFGAIVPPSLSNVVAIAAGSTASAALRSDGKIIFWGVGSNGQTNAPPGLNEVSAIAMGNTHTLALRSDSMLFGMGGFVDQRQGPNGPGLIPPGLGGVLSMAGGTHSVAVRTNGTVTVWGSSTAAITNVPANATNGMEVAAGDLYSVLLQSNGNVVAWGSISAAGGQGAGTTNVPAVVSDAVAVTAGSTFAFAIIGDGSPLITRQPVGGTTFVGRDFSVRPVVTGAAPLSFQWQFNGVNIPDATNSTLTLSGLSTNNAGIYQLLVTNASGAAASVPVPLTVLDVPNLSFLSPLPPLQTNYQAGKLILNASVLGNGPLTYQWQINATNVTSGTNSDLVFDPVLVSNAGNYTLSVSNVLGGISSAISTQRVMLAKPWGYFSNDPPATLTNAIAIASGYSGEGSTFGAYLTLRSDGKIVGWGPTTFNVTNVPPSVTNSFVTAIAAGYEDGLALRADGTVAAWGYYIYGVTNPPASASNVIAIACGDYHDLALRADGSVVVWGQGTAGQTNIPSSVTNVVAISGGGQHSLALRANGTVVGWGLNNIGQTTIPSNATNVIAISAGFDNNLALRADGTIVQWGNGKVGVPPAGLSNIVAIAAGYSHNLVLRNDGVPILWGNYYNGTAVIPPDVVNVAQISTRGDRDLALFGTRAPAATVQPFDRSLIQGSNTLLAAKFSGLQPVTYQWQCNGTNVFGATADTLALANVQVVQSGVYQLAASNSYGVTLSRAANVTVVPLVPPVITLQPVNRTTNAGATVRFTVIATGINPLSYQWQKNGTNSVGINSNVLTLVSLTRSNGGLYSVAVSNIGGVSISSNAVLKVIVPQKFRSGALIANGSINFLSGDSDGGLLTTDDLANFTAQASTDLINWTNLPNALSITNGQLMLQDPVQTSVPARFYRIIEN